MSATSNYCPRCGTALSADAPKGLCPRCLSAMNLATETVLTGADAVAAQPPLTPEELAPHFPQLEILECLGRGGMGVVYKARQKTLHRLVALKLLAPERVEDAKFAERFAHEAQALARLNHPSIVAVHDFGQAGGFFYLLMEFVDGVNLRQALKAGRFTPEQALAIVPPVCEALQYAHEQGVVHRDIKPENLLLDKEGRVKIADFGIAKMLHTNGSDVGLAESQPAGTPQYMAPEQKEHHRTDHRADIYSLGVVLYEMLTGELPADKLQPPSKRVQVDVRIDEIVLRALEVKPELRFQTAADFRARVENVKSKEAVAQADVSTSLPGTRFRLFDERGGRRMIAWRSVLVVAIAVLAIALVVGAASSLVAKGAPPLLIIVAFAGLAALLTLGTRLRFGTWPLSEADERTSPPRFSRAAIIGACWVPMTLFSFVATAMATFQIRGDSTKDPEWWQVTILIPALILGVAGPFGTTILGWVAVSQIRRSAGRIHGLQLALFDGLVFPLMVLSGIIALGNVAVAKMFVDFYANPSAIGNPHIGLVTGLANWLSQNNEVAVIVGVVTATVVDVLVFRTVLRAVRGEVSSATPETRAPSNEIKAASIAIIFALIAASLGALSAFRNAAAWPAMALSCLFAGLAIFMALPVRRLGVGKCALVIAALGMVIWPLAAFLVRPARVAERAQVAGIEKIEVAADRALISQSRYDLEGMIIMFGSASNRWTPSGVFLDAMFDVALEPHRLDGGATWVMKPRHGIHSNYRLDGPPGPMLGQIAFHAGTAAMEPDGSYVIGEFKPDNGKPLPILVKLDKTASAPSTPPGKGSAVPAVSEKLTPTQRANPLGLGIPWLTIALGLFVLFILGTGAVVLVVLFRKRSGGTKILAVLLGAVLMVLLLIVGAVVVRLGKISAIQQQAVAAESRERQQTIADAGGGRSCTRSGGQTSLGWVGHCPQQAERADRDQRYHPKQSGGAGRTAEARG
ncbi:MAG: hypothetical protein JWM16_801 [Verrucomicrobiales bacterium]|nr:hypothetical protein [Verrucomicrobiales bacterium]